MKLCIKLVLTVLLTFSFTASIAQEPSVKRVYQDPVDLSAAKYKRKDLNGVTCALVKVQIVADDVEFFGNVVGDVDRKAGEYWVYLIDGTKMFRIQSNSFIPVNITFADYDIPAVLSNNTYVVTLELPPPTGSRPSNAGFNYLILTVSPPDAKVIVGGKPREVKNGQSKVLLKTGTYDFHVESPGYIPEDGSVTVRSAKVEKTVTLKSTKGAVSITSATPGTEIFINGDKVGTGSWSGSLLPDTYSIEGRREGFYPAEIIHTVNMGDNGVVAIPELTPMLGSANIDFEPTGSKITIDGKDFGVTPNVVNGLTAGNHSVTISHEGYVSETLTVTILESDVTTVTGVLDENKYVEVVGEQAHFPGGETAMFKFLSNILNYPSAAVEDNVQGKVYIGFTVEKDGSLSNFRVLRGKHPALDAEALRVVKNLPNFIPANQNGIPVRQEFSLPINFRLDSGKSKKEKKIKK